MSVDQIVKEFKRRRRDRKKKLHEIRYCQSADSRYVTYEKEIQKIRKGSIK
jgi:hypothetical protein